MLVALLPWYLLWALSRFAKDREQRVVHNGMVYAINNNDAVRQMFVEYLKKD